jgi:hypothetical protein
VLYGFETWSLTLKEEYGQRVLVNRLLRKVFGSESDEVIRRRRKLHSEEVYDYYFSSNIIWVIISWIMRWEGNVACIMEKRNAYSVLAGKPEGKRLLQRPQHRWGNNIKMDLTDIGWDGVDWINLAQDMYKC